MKWRILIGILLILPVTYVNAQILILVLKFGKLFTLEIGHPRLIAGIV